MAPSVVDTDEVLPELLGDGGALLGDHGLLVHADQDGLVGLHDVHTTDQNKSSYFTIRFYCFNFYLVPFFPLMTLSAQDRNMYLTPPTVIPDMGSTSMLP